MTSPTEANSSPPSLKGREDQRPRAVPEVRFRATGRAAHARIAPLVPPDWIDVSPYKTFTKGRSSSRPKDECGNDGTIHHYCNDENSNDNDTDVLIPPDFVWENAPHKDTKSYRDMVRCYSHLPNGVLLDSKWALARIFAAAQEEEDNGEDVSPPPLQQLETHCFRGISGWQRIEKLLIKPQEFVRDDAGFCDPLHCKGPQCDDSCSFSSSSPSLHGQRSFYDLADPDPSWDAVRNAPKPPSSSSWWAIKDAGSNGAGGVWMVDSATNLSSFADPRKAGASSSSPLLENHSYVAQRYAWPPVLYAGRKCHVRAYALITSDGRAHVHDRCFLHVANDPFNLRSECIGQASIHITNCCANSHDPARFAGEICARLSEVDSNQKEEEVSLVPFADPIRRVVATLARRIQPFVQGGVSNGGFEYLGLDFILSHDVRRTGQPAAYLLEVNAPPSQDTATGLPHAEQLHDCVIADLLSLWVLPRVLGVSERAGGWRCVHHPEASRQKTPDYLPPIPAETRAALSASQSALLNKMRWAICERKAQRRDSLDRQSVAIRIRSHYPFFQGSGGSSAVVFMESAGGSQVPEQVTDRVSWALSCRHRTTVGRQAMDGARQTLHALLGASPEDFDMFFGSNATTLLMLLAHWYLKFGFVTGDDEIIVSSDNHLANVTPWLDVANRVGAKVHWCPSSRADSIVPLVTARTRLVAVAHASNILGQVRDVKGICRAVREMTAGRAHVVVDGVATAPHLFTDLDSAQPDWYVISCHKLFGPHLGTLLGRKASARSICADDDHSITRHLEAGTVNYEACAGIEGLGLYYSRLAEIGSGTFNKPLDRDTVLDAYWLIAYVERPLIKLLGDTLRKNPKVRVLNDAKGNRGSATKRIPVYSFVHRDIAPCRIVDACHEKGIVCRSGTFLSSTLFQQEYSVCRKEGVVRISLAHYSTVAEVQQLVNALEAIPGWM
jgi:selenocysteine lyase/cysteine desulfurase